MIFEEFKNVIKGILILNMKGRTGRRI